MAKKRYADVVEMMRDLVEDPAFAKDLEEHLAQRRLVTELVALRSARGLTQEEVAGKIGITQGRLSKIEASTDGDLSFATLVKYAHAIDFGVEITLVRKEVTLVDRVKHHAFCIKRLTDHSVRLGSKDVQIAHGVGKFLQEAAFHLVALIKSSATLLPSPTEEKTPAITVNVYEAEERDEGESAEMKRSKKKRMTVCAQ